jgi:glycosyltransferase involved in cell wall biosynthesis
MNRPLRVLHINHGDTVRLTGGTAVATLRLHEALRGMGVDSHVLCKHVEGRGEHVHPMRSSRATAVIERVLRPLARAAGLNDMHAFSTFGLGQQQIVSSSDVLHLHCIHEGYFNYLALPRLTAQKPTVFTMHDIWALTGHCAVDVGCERWKTGCGRCPRLDVVSVVRRDATRIEWRLKRWAYERSKMVIVSPSRWLDGLVAQSMLGHFERHVIPHGVDLQALQPRDPDACRRALGITPGKRVLMTIGSGSRFKGSDLLAAALQALPASLRRDLVLLAMGDSPPADVAAAGVEVVPIGFINGDIAKSVAFSAADAFVFPTRGESFGLVALESIACGTPVAAFDVGGVPDVVRDGETGWLARPESPGSMANAIEQLLAMGSQSDNLRRRARDVAEREFSIGLEARRYAAVYGKLAKRVPQGRDARGASVKDGEHGNRQD